MRDKLICMQCEHYHEGGSKAYAYPTFLARDGGKPRIITYIRWCDLADPICAFDEYYNSLLYEECHIPANCPWYPAQYLNELEVNQSRWKRLKFNLRNFYIKVKQVFSRKGPLD